ncbi:MAG: hypothetical protein HFJ30_02500 [Clostridia bacterium]|jgi:RNA chaperone Hfq|nr:hypothetical protein [Clostridia bacterium]MCI9413101.1 hypothetical protein [Clostridia bacterium]
MNVETLRKYLEKNNKLIMRTVRMFLVNGFQMVGTIVELEDGWLVFSDNQGQEKVIFLHAISTIE